MAQVGVHDHENLTHGGGIAFCDRGGEAELAGPADRPDWVLRCKLFGPRGSPVRAVVIDDQYLDINAGSLARVEDPLQELVDIASFVVRRDNH